MPASSHSKRSSMVRTNLGTLAVLGRSGSLGEGGESVSTTMRLRSPRRGPPATMTWLAQEFVPWRSTTTKPKTRSSSSSRVSVMRSSSPGWGCSRTPGASAPRPSGPSFLRCFFSAQSTMTSRTAGATWSTGPSALKALR